MAGELTLAELRQWEEAGATWHAVRLTGQEVTVQLCACTGEPVELRHGTQPELVDHVSTRRSSEP